MKCFVVLLCLIVAGSISEQVPPPNSYIELTEGIKHQDTFYAGSSPQVYLVKPSSSTLNVRVYRKDRFTDSTTQLLLCHMKGEIPSCNYSYQSYGYDQTMLWVTIGAEYYFTLSQAGKKQTFSYQIEQCSGQCSSICTLDCDGHGVCDSFTYKCSCDEGYYGSYCAYDQSEQDNLKEIRNIIIISCVVGGFFLVVLPLIIITLCCCGVICVGCCPRRTTTTIYQPINSQPPISVYTQQQQQPIYQQQQQQYQYQQQQQLPPSVAPSYYSSGMPPPPTPLQYNPSPITPTH